MDPITGGYDASLDRSSHFTNVVRFVDGPRPSGCGWRPAWMSTITFNCMSDGTITRIDPVDQGKYDNQPRFGGGCGTMPFAMFDADIFKPWPDE